MQIQTKTFRYEVEADLHWMRSRFSLYENHNGLLLEENQNQLKPEADAKLTTTNATPPCTIVLSPPSTIVVYPPSKSIFEPVAYLNQKLLFDFIEGFLLLKWRWILV
ncbi:hypothetical protein L6452_38787 [Arctium lappa]|uniref:Uncharacterized protein n=1 Tax=Arctium lappa TaxID=4217 RepID=A0ACB8XQ17_ARCLA|nr:hypothetical protein L6452_38787 [Arctium lappa]